MSKNEQRIIMGLLTAIILIGLIALFLFQSQVNQVVYEAVRLTERHNIELTNEAIRSRP